MISSRIYAESCDKKFTRTLRISLDIRANEIKSDLLKSSFNSVSVFTYFIYLLLGHHFRKIFIWSFFYNVNHRKQIGGCLWVMARNLVLFDGKLFSGRLK